MWRGVAVVLAVLSVVVVGMWAFFWLRPPSTEIAYRQTVTIEGPNGPVSASGVFREVIRYNGFTLGQTGPSMVSYVRGEALTFDVPGVGLVVQSLMRRPTIDGNRMGTVISDACRVRPPSVGSPLDAMFWLSTLDSAFVTSCQLPVDKSQLVVVFRKLGQPADATAYLPEYLPKELRVTSIVLERTTDEPSYGRLPRSLWAKAGQPLQQLIIEPRGNERSASFTVGESSFVTE